MQAPDKVLQPGLWLALTIKLAQIHLLHWSSLISDPNALSALA